MAGTVPAVELDQLHDVGFVGFLHIHDDVIGLQEVVFVLGQIAAAQPLGFTVHHGRKPSFPCIRNPEILQSRARSRSRTHKENIERIYASVTKSFFIEYLDYLEMQQKFYGKVKEKYPTHFKTEHDIMALKVNQARLLAKCEDFEQQNESIKDLAYSGSGYCIVVPTKPEELAEEGINLSHCVGQYIDRVAGGDCHILFLRRRGAPDRSLVTLQLSGKQICQAQGFNRRPITDQERRFLVQWGREKDIQIAV